MLPTPSCCTLNIGDNNLHVRYSWANIKRGIGPIYSSVNNKKPVFGLITLQSGTCMDHIGAETNDGC